ncbi:bifunctional ADP-dependent NAD(P)H-hydrate dehydratase/NAD(P)H-hydrate epimerase [Bifidobacterium xylocopae]|uniref:Multifunctional fusion protein n=1 Tax=Bifidobacterium xylocopae TaxID=2493119 RepID=A0A366KC61_9BIFI|nr:bifunctional ADP-dependent NAD(P)H-hydrate dehydratase/NAD(P)H-hydrate epimerase [Bifidobacterium xylocopae]RBP99310.1 carbohydrate kinase [Bifidobacterium xylocopae]
MNDDETWTSDQLAEAAYRSQTIRTLERPLLDDGVPLMRMAAKAVALNARLMLSLTGVELDQARVVLLAGGGDNGGDGLYAGALLARAGADVTAVAVGSELHDEGCEAFRTAGGLITALDPQADIPDVDVPSSPGEDDEHLGQAVELAKSADLVIDAMTGIGLNGALHGLPEALAEGLGLPGGDIPEDAGALMRWRGKRPLVLAVDVPSGIGVDDGSLPGAYIPADVTVTFGAMKPCALLPPAAYACGRTVLVDFGFDIAGLRPDVEAMSAERVGGLIRRPRLNDSKYSRGVVGLVTGSEQFPGAAVLSTRAAAAGGAGMVRYTGPNRAVDSVLVSLPEAVIGEGRVEALVLGSGVPARGGAESDDDGQRGIIATILEDRAGDTETLEDGQDDTPVPVVVDAGALDMLPPGQHMDNLLLTPHYGELARLLQDYGETIDADGIAAEPLRWALRAWRMTGANVLLKGAITLVVSDDGNGRPRIRTSGFGPAWLATAGSGDVLAGVEGAFLASRTDLLSQDYGSIGELAAAGAFLHGLAASLASGSRQRSWRMPLLYDPEEAGDFLERARTAWLEGSQTDGDSGPLGHPIHAGDLIDSLEEAQGLLLALPFAAAEDDGEDSEDDEENHDTSSLSPKPSGNPDNTGVASPRPSGLNPAAIFEMESLWF